MLSILVIIILVILCVSTLFKPWIGVCVYYFVSLTNLSALNPHIFSNIRISFWIGSFTIAGLFFYSFKSKEIVDFKKLYTKESILLFALLIFTILSHFTTSFSNYIPTGKQIDPNSLLPIFITMIIFYFVSILIVDTSKKLDYLIFTFIISVLLLTFWSNERFVYYGYAIFTEQGRMTGPGEQDENIFALRLLVVLPFLMYLITHSTNKKLLCLCYISLPLVWHSIFLTGSRGGLLATLVITLIFTFRSKSFILKAILISGLSIAIFTQSGQLINRFEQIQNQEINVSEKAINGRVESWEIGLTILKDNPLSGVGFERFQQATTAYGYSTPYVVHNTFMQFTLNSGIFAGFIFLYLIYISIINFLKNNPMHWTEKSSALSILGFSCAAIFLNLAIYEITYFLLLINRLSRELNPPKTLDSKND